MTDARRVLDLAMSEAQWQATVIDMARTLGWTCLHVNDSRKQVCDRETGEYKLVGDQDAAGLLDWLLLRERVVWVETKAERGRLRIAQEHVLAAIRRAGGEAYVWRPSDWDAAQRVLRMRLT